MFKTKRLLSILLTLTMVFTILPVFALPALAAGVTNPAWRVNADFTITEYATLSLAFDDGNPNRIQDGETLYLIDGIIDGADNYDVTVDCDVTIQGTDDNDDGQYSIIDAQTLGQIFILDSDINVTINNITFTNGETGGDGAAILNNGATLAITDSFFIDNLSTVGRGGAVFQDETGSLTLDNVVFEGNTASEGGAVYLDDAGLLKVGGGTEFCDNTANSGGGAIYNDGMTEIGAGTVFSGNEVSIYGGAIYSNGTLTVTESMFTGNLSTNGNGGAIFNAGTMTVSDSTFSGNNAPNLGGAILNGGDMGVSGSTFTGNNAETGGAINNENYMSNITVDNSTFIGNNATDNGGAIYIVGGAATIANSTIYGNDSGIYALEGVTNVLNSIVVSNNITPGVDIFGDNGSVVNLYHTLYGDSDGTVNVLADSESRSVLDIFGTDFPALADNGGPTETIAVATDSQTAGQGVRTAVSDNGVYGYWDGAEWVWLDGGDYAVFTEIGIDQRGVGRGTSRVSTGAYQSPAAYTVTWETSGGGGAATYTVTFNTNGGSMVSSKPVSSGGKMAKPADPTKDGYTFAGWYSDAALTKEYDFNASVTRNITVYAKWIESIPDGSVSIIPPGAKKLPFTDVKENDWFYGDVEYVYNNGLMNGTNETLFSPNSNLTGAMLVTILWRLEGSPAASGGNPFDYVPEGQWYTDAIKWAATNDIVNGYGDNNFGPNDSITREQLAVILMRYMNYKEINLPVTVEWIIFADESSISNYAMDALQTLNKLGIVNGTGKNADGQTIVNPQGYATRAEAAAILHRFLELIVE